MEMPKNIFANKKAGADYQPLTRQVSRNNKDCNYYLTYNNLDLNQSERKDQFKNTIFSDRKRYSHIVIDQKENSHPKKIKNLKT